MEPCYKDRCFRFINRSAITLATFSAMYFAESSILAGKFSEGVRYKATKEDHPTLFYEENYNQFLSNDPEFVKTKPLQVLYFMYNEHFGMHDGKFNCTVDFFDYENMSDKACFNLMVDSYPEAFLDIALLHKRGMFEITEDIKPDGFKDIILSSSAMQYRFVSRAMKNITLLPSCETNTPDLVVLKNLLSFGLRLHDMSFFNKIGEMFNMDGYTFRDCGSVLIKIVDNNEPFFEDSTLLSLCCDDSNKIQSILSSPDVNGLSVYVLVGGPAGEIGALTYADLAALCGSVKCFRLLVKQFNEIKITDVTMHFALIGENTDIIHLCKAEFSNNKFSEYFHPYLEFDISGISDYKTLEWALDNNIANRSFDENMMSLQEIKILLNLGLFDKSILSDILGRSISRVYDGRFSAEEFDYLLKFVITTCGFDYVRSVSDEVSSLLKITNAEIFSNKGNPAFVLLKKHGIELNENSQTPMMCADYVREISRSYGDSVKLYYMFKRYNRD